jgi:outer membrane protein W
VKTKHVLFLLAMTGVLGLAPPAAQAERLGSYVALKGGVYSPSATFSIDNIDVETTFDGDTELGAAGELAFGHYFLPTFALEVGAGYFQGRGSLAAESASVDKHDLNFNVIPILVTAKALIPVGVVDPYGELGVGAYFTKMEVSDNLNTFSGTTTYGMHTGAGLNVNITQNAFLGAEGRYVWANPSFGDEKIKLNDTEYALNGFKLNGFTTTLVLGFSF